MIKISIAALMILMTSCSNMGNKNTPTSESGYILNGKRYVLYRDGKKIDVASPKEQQRDPASRYTQHVKLFFEEDEYSICYFMKYQMRKTSRVVDHMPLSCVRK